MFLHWGLYAIHGWHEQEEWRGKVPRREYEELIHQWNPQQFNPDSWLDLAQAAGMEYLCLTTKHHDGFCLWDTKLTDFNTMKSPYGKDIVRQLSDACHRRGVPLCLYYSIVDWHNPYYPNQSRSHELAPKPGDHPDYAKYLEFLKGQVRELCTNYGTISGFWWDMKVDKITDRSINQLVRQLQPSAVINNRGFDEGDFGTPERDYHPEFDKSTSFSRRTEACQSVGMESWGYRKDEDYYSDQYLTSSIDKYRARDANYLLNVGPDSTGVIPPEPTAILKRLGIWYKRVREAFDNAVPTPGLVSDTRLLITRRNNTLYVHLYQQVLGEEVKLRPIAIAPKHAVLLNDGRQITWALDHTPSDFEETTPFLRLRQLPVNEFAGTTMIIRLDFDDLSNLRPAATRPSVPIG